MHSGRYALQPKPQLVTENAEVLCDLHGFTTLNFVDEMHRAVAVAKQRGQVGKRIGFITGPGSHSGSGKKKKGQSSKPVLLEEVEELVMGSWNRTITKFPDGITCTLTTNLFDHLELVNANKLA
jgi:hypothetical protein